MLGHFPSYFLPTFVSKEMQPPTYGFERTGTWFSAWLKNSHRYAYSNILAKAATSLRAVRFANPSRRWQVMASFVATRSVGGGKYSGAVRSESFLLPSCAVQERRVERSKLMRIRCPSPLRHGKVTGSRGLTEEKKTSLRNISGLER